MEAAQAPPEPPPGAGFLPACREQAELRPPGHAAAVCVQCGQLFCRGRGVGAPCRLSGVLGPRSVAPLVSGRFDAALAAAHAKRSGTASGLASGGR